MLRLMMGALLMACCAIGAAHAVDIYQWKDSGGVTHFTDNAMNVPEQYRKIAKRKVNKLRTSGGKDTLKEKFKTLAEQAWFDKCAACHTTSENKKDKLGLGALAVNQKTNFPATIEEIIPKLRSAANGGLSGMARLEVSNAELKKIAKFILGAQ
ncbi:MAG: hypothetical protein COB41_01195 [Proteobacteria bacterium]|nr:DUF4124 domain-containing protein [bacterium AH-315-G11]PCI45600.1 MAG: hypothetical protein COB41_01195 [Pseudomonadota bacterium]